MTRLQLSLKFSNLLSYFFFFFYQTHAWLSPTNSLIFHIDFSRSGFKFYIALSDVAATGAWKSFIRHMCIHIELNPWNCITEMRTVAICVMSTAFRVSREMSGDERCVKVVETSPGTISKRCLPGSSGLAVSSLTWHPCRSMQPWNTDGIGATLPSLLLTPPCPRPLYVFVCLLFLHTVSFDSLHFRIKYF